MDRSAGRKKTKQVSYGEVAIGGEEGLLHGILGFGMIGENEKTAAEDHAGVAPMQFLDGFSPSVFIRHLDQSHSTRER